MNTRPLSQSLLLVLAAALFAAAVPVGQALAQSQTDSKIRLMSEALRARDSGDLATAKRLLAQLAQLSPNDPAVTRLRNEIDAMIAAAAAPQPAPVVAPAPAAPQAAIDVTIPEPGRIAPAVAPVPAGPEQEAEALARAEAARISELTAGGQRMLASARSQLRQGKYDDAIATVDAALATLPANPLTQRLIADLQKEKASAPRGADRAQSARPGQHALERTRTPARAEQRACLCAGARRQCPRD